MRQALTVLVTLAGAAAFATGAMAGDAAKDAAAVEYDGGCGFGQVFLQAQPGDGEATEKAEVRAKLEALVDSALNARETAAVPAQTPIPTPGKGG